jgi:hypothetical protein
MHIPLVFRSFAGGDVAKPVIGAGERTRLNHSALLQSSNVSIAAMVQIDCPCPSDHCKLV